MAFDTAGAVIFPHALSKGLNQTYNFATITKKAILMATAPTGDDEFLDNGTANDISSRELSTTGYVGGFSGAGRKTLTGSFTISVDVSDTTSLKTIITHSTTYTWATLGTAGVSVAGICIVAEVTNDAASHPLLWLPFEEPYELSGASETWTPPATLVTVLHSSQSG